ncbi:hypothetical protein F5883DRAFT_95504 [Diaporthe sp. PMI_573]|nr:hypothetical protein F5883DRAFT_95504 [Diaporthaceae sp. PMI_573]
MLIPTVYAACHKSNLEGTFFSRNFSTLVLCLHRPVRCPCDSRSLICLNLTTWTSATRRICNAKDLIGTTRCAAFNRRAFVHPIVCILSLKRALIFDRKVSIAKVESEGSSQTTPGGGHYLTETRGERQDWLDSCQTGRLAVRGCLAVRWAESTEWGADGVRMGCRMQVGGEGFTWPTSWPWHWCCPGRNGTRYSFFVQKDPKA